MTDETQDKLEGFIVEMRGELRAIDVRLSRIEAILPTFATKVDLEAIKVIVPTLATKADLASIKADLAKLESTMLKWFVGTTLSATGIASGIAFTIAKLMQ